MGTLTQAFSPDRSAPARPMGDMAVVRMSEAGNGDLPEGCGIDPETGEVTHSLSRRLALWHTFLVPLTGIEQII